MKVNFKRMITVLAATAMCAAPMTSAMSASAAGRSYSLAKADKQAEEAYVAELLTLVSSEDVAIVKGEASFTLQDSIKEQSDNVFNNSVFEMISKEESSMEVAISPMVTGLNFNDKIGDNMVTYVYPPMTIVGTYGTNTNSLNLRDDMFFNKYNQRSGHAIKTTTVGVNV